MCMGQSLTCFSIPKKKVWPCESETIVGTYTVHDCIYQLIGSLAALHL